ncbi:MAG: hypothetical protein AAGE01_08825 [Pseudomonadota bacterium]
MTDKDTATIMALLERLRVSRLPRAESLKAKVDRGEVLGDRDIAFLKRVFEDGRRVKPLIDRHPEYQDLAARLVHLYEEITRKALENQKAAE